MRTVKYREALVKGGLLLVIVGVIWLLTACRSMRNYETPDSPFFAGSYAETTPEFDGHIQVVSWNIKFANNIEAAIVELTTAESLREADILLLQEMDEVGVETIAQSLQYNYVYYPASVHTHHNKNFGNAILSRWPISKAAKLLLPFENPRNQQRRIATRAVVTVANRPVLTYSVHTETIWLYASKRLAQLDTIVEDIGPDPTDVIVGGDFNTFTEEGIDSLEAQFGAAGLERVSTGPTMEASGLQFTLDHIFVRGMIRREAGVWSDSGEVSDHFPLWVKLAFERNPSLRQ